MSDPHAPEQAGPAARIWSNLCAWQAASLGQRTILLAIMEEGFGVKDRSYSTDAFPWTGYAELIAKSREVTSSAGPKRVTYAVVIVGNRFGLVTIEAYPTKPPQATIRQIFEASTLKDLNMESLEALSAAVQTATAQALRAKRNVRVAEINQLDRLIAEVGPPIAP